MHGLLSRSALSVDRDAGHGLRQPRCQCCGAGDVAGLGADVVQATEDDVVDGGGIDVVPANDGLDDVRRHVGRVFCGESAVSLADRSPDGVDDEGFRHEQNLTQI